MQLIYNGSAIGGSVQLPQSKSISNRILVIQHLSGKPIHIHNLSESDDTILLKGLLEEIKNASLGLSNSEERVINAGNAGTVFRFLAAVLSITPGNWLLTGSQRMLERPCQPLVDSLIALGACIKYTGRDGFPPLQVEGKDLTFNPIHINTSQSSQFASALLMLCSTTTSPLTLTISENAVSLPYLDMTIGVMNALGMSVQRQGNRIYIQNTSISVNQYTVEADWSSAAFIYELCAISPHSVISISDLKQVSLQGDRRLAEIFRDLGVNTVFHEGGITIKNSGHHTKAIRLDLSDAPDLVPAVVCTCAGLNVEVSINGIGHLRLKESDRIAVLVEGLTMLGCKISATADGLHLRGKVHASPNTLLVCGDHRMAMAFAPLVTVMGTLSIDDPTVVSKSFPDFWNQFQNLTGIQY